MGDSVDNVYVLAHRQNTSPAGRWFALRLHRGDMSIDTVSPEVGAGAWEDLRSLVIAQAPDADLDAWAASTALAGWWSAYVAPAGGRWRGQIRYVVTQ